MLKVNLAHETDLRTQLAEYREWRLNANRFMKNGELEVGDYCFLDEVEEFIIRRVKVEDSTFRKDNDGYMDVFDEFDLKTYRKEVGKIEKKFPYKTGEKIKILAITETTVTIIKTTEGTDQYLKNRVNVNLPKDEYLKAMRRVLLPHIGEDYTPGM